MDSKLRCVFDMPDQNVSRICFMHLLCYSVVGHVIISNVYVKISMKFYNNVIFILNAS